MLLKRSLLILLVCLLTVVSFGRSLDEIRRSGKIYVAFTSTDLKNINYDLALEFARYLNVELIEVEIEWSDVFKRNGTIPPDMETNPDLIYTPDALKESDLICSTFTILDWRKRLFGFAIHATILDQSLSDISQNLQDFRFAPIMKNVPHIVNISMAWL